MTWVLGLDDVLENVCGKSIKPLHLMGIVYSYALPKSWLCAPLVALKAPEVLGLASREVQLFGPIFDRAHGKGQT